MKVKASPKMGKVLVELGAKDEKFLQPSLFQIQRILSPVDFSSASRKALQYAIHLGGVFGAEIVLVHVIQPFILPVEPDFIPPELTTSQMELAQTTRCELDEWCAQEIGGRVRFQTQVRQGVPWHEIVDVARETITDLIILATHGRTGFKHVLLGSVVERVIRHAPCPVLVVREQERDFVPANSEALSSAKQDSQAGSKTL